jgi:uncharacterized membrane protein
MDRHLFQFGPDDWQWRMRVAASVAFLIFGVDHLANPGRYLPMMPAYLPWHLNVVLFTGLSEIAGALGLLLPTTRRIAGMSLAVYLAAVMPANVQNLLNAIDGATVPGLPTEPRY